MKNKITQKITVAGAAIVLLAFISNNYAAQPASPSPDQQLYTVELPVTGENEGERKQGFAKALEQILIKDSQIITSALIKAALANPGVYVQRYTYINRKNMIGQQSLVLQIQFDQTSITQLLQQVQTTQKASAGAKQQTLIWLARITPRGDKIIEDKSNNDGIISLLEKNAKDFGVSIMLPVVDLQDVNQIKANDICNLNMATIKTASQRYGTNTIVAGCIKQSTAGNTCSGQWLLMRDNRSDTLNFTGTTAENVIMQAMRAIAPNIMSTEKQPINQAKKLTLRITNVQGLEQYNEVLHYLTACDQITRVDLVKIGTTEVELSINITGDQQKLLATLIAQNKLVRNTDAAALPPGIDLDYKWVTIGNEQTPAISIKPAS
jgi:uncharacterized protein